MNEKVARLDNQLNDIQFQKDERGVFLHCVEMKSMHGCENYQVNIEHVDGDYVTSKKDFRYDDVQVKEAIVPAITLLK